MSKGPNPFTGTNQNDKVMKKFVIITHNFMEDPYLEKNGEGFTMLFHTTEQAQEIIDENDWEDSFVIELTLDM